MNLVRNKVCVISGAGKGFGRRLAEIYFREGAKLGLITRGESDFRQLQKVFESESSNVIVFKGDVAKRASVFSFKESLLKKFGKIDVLINNAGMRFRRPFLEIEPSEFEEVLNCNLVSMFHMCQAFLPEMKENGGGKIINMSSVLGTHGLADLSGYITSKAGIVGLTKALAVEFAEHKVNINCVAPGFCKTSYFEEFVQQRPQLYDFTLERIPLQKWGSSDDVVNSCLFLSSEMSNYITGQTIHVDGGWSAW